jgi:pantoate--beta-alanine ligase
MQRLAQTWQKAGIRVGFVPTMGYLHAGHLSLVSVARKQVGPAPAQVVLSVYVNPTQFGPHEDLAKYPRDLRRDLQLCRDAGVDVVFIPSDAEMYPKGESTQRGFSTYVLEQSLSQGMEGTARPTHFRGVTTIVAKLFNLVLPEVAVFGSKDYQQAAVVRRMVRDLNFPLKLVVAPTLREPDGLAMSSRNKYLTPTQRLQAAVLWQAITDARATVRKAAKTVAAASLRNQLRKLIEQQPEARLDYLEFFDPETLVPTKSVRPGVHLALAVFVGKTRLIDNARL